MKKNYLIIGGVIMIFSVICYSAFFAQTPFDKGMNYLMSTPIESWHPSEYTYLYYFWKQYPQTMDPIVFSVQKQTNFEKDYPFVFSLFDQVKMPPSEKELEDPVAQFLVTFDSCGPHQPKIYLDFAKAKNTFDFNDPVGFYSASHAVLLTSAIVKTYPHCGDQIDIDQAKFAMGEALKGLNIKSDEGLLFPDAYLEQECARALATGVVDPIVSAYVNQSQDSSGGWNAYDSSNPNQPREINPHTTISAICILGVESGVFV